MKIKHETTHVEEIELSKDNIKDVVERYIRTKYNLPKGVYYDDGKLKISIEEHGGSHSWFDENILRKPTPTDLMLMGVLSELRNEN